MEAQVSDHRAEGKQAIRSWYRKPVISAPKLGAKAQAHPCTYCLRDRESQKLTEGPRALQDSIRGWCPERSAGSSSAGASEVKAPWRSDWALKASGPWSEKARSEELVKGHLLSSS
eukprot:760528-Hanusia_phi.AAC.2